MNITKIGYEVLGIVIKKFFIKKEGLHVIFH